MDRQAQVRQAQTLHSIAKEKQTTLGIAANCSLHLLNGSQTSILHTWPITHVRGFGTLRIQDTREFVFEVHGIRSKLYLQGDAARIFAALSQLTQHLRRAAETEESSLKKHLQTLGFAPQPIDGDGNCQFRAIADQLFQDQGRYPEIRQHAVSWMTKNGGAPPDPTMPPEFALSNFVDSDLFPSWQDFVQYHAQDKNWGDHITLIATANQLQIHIVVFSSVADAPQLTISPTPVPKKKLKTIYLYHWHDCHYGSLQPTKKK